MRGEPEALTAEDQHLITQHATDREHRAWITSRDRLLSELEHLTAHVHSPHVTRTARALHREITALDRRLTTR
jgi:hypothetical protein